MLTNKEYPLRHDTAARIYKECIQDDCYKLRALAVARRDWQPAAIFDIGANIGFVSVQARMLWPQARIVAFEPCPETFDVLSVNVEHLGIVVCQAALAEAPSVGMRRDPQTDGSNQVVASNQADGIATFTLPRILRCQAPGSYILKLDCEGGEAVLAHSVQARQTLAAAAHWALEYHTNLVRLDPEKFLDGLRQADPRAVGCHSEADRWLMWSASTATN